MKTSPEGKKLIREFESCRLKAYKDQAGIWTISIGCIRYEDGSRVKEGDVISQERADALFGNTLPKYEDKVNQCLRKPVTQNQFDSLVSFHYNTGALQQSTLLKLVNANPNNPAIEEAFLAWNKARVNGELRVIPGLTKRRQKESDNYFLKTT